MHVVDAFVNSQEWTVSRKLHDIRLVIASIFAHVPKKFLFVLY